VGAFQRGDDTFKPREFHEGFKRLVVGGVGVFGAAGVAQPRVFRPDGGVNQSPALTLCVDWIWPNSSAK